MNVLKLLPNKFKVWALKNLYSDIASKGDEGDTALAHVNSFEVALLRAVGGSGTINARTGLLEFKGGGSSKPSESKSVTTNLPEYAQPYYQELMKQAGKETYTTDASGAVTGVQEYNPYGGTRVAEFTDQQAALRSELGGLQTPDQFGTAQTGLQQGTNLGLGAAQTGITNALGFAPGSLANLGVDTPQTFGANQAAQYMSPYQQNVTDVQLAEARRQADITKNQQALGSIGRGTFGGGRQALMSSEGDRNLARQLGEIQATGSQSAFENAQKQFGADRTAQMAAEQQNLQADMDQRSRQQQGEQFAIGLQKDIGLQGLSTGLEGAAKTGTMAAQEQKSNLERLRSQATSAAEVQALDQEIANIDYQVFREEEDYQRKLIQFQSDILRGNAGALGSTVTSYAPPPSMASQLAGLGIAGVGLANQLRPS
tara:strand:+ start:2204 stop:3487 length:1284 start_codon:yes stop_codon:yes gene_type:complete